MNSIPTHHDDKFLLLKHILRRSNKDILHSKKHVSGCINEWVHHFITVFKQSSKTLFWYIQIYTVQHTVYPHVLPIKSPGACIHRYAQKYGWNRTIYVINSQARASRPAVALRVSHTTKNITQGHCTQMRTKRVASPETACDCLWLPVTWESAASDSKLL